MENKKQNQKQNQKKGGESTMSTTKAYMYYLKDNTDPNNPQYILDKDGRKIPTSLGFTHNGNKYNIMLLPQIRKTRDKKTGEVLVTEYYDVVINNADAKAEEAI